MDVNMIADMVMERSGSSIQLDEWHQCGFSSHHSKSDSERLNNLCDFIRDEFIANRITPEFYTRTLEIISHL